MQLDQQSTVLSLCPTTGFQWSGCSDNLSYGVAFSQTFVDEPERAKGLSAGRPLMNIHNNEAGRKVGDDISVHFVICRDPICSAYIHRPFHPQAILHNMQVECKCHGVSGSCELRTCWKVMPPFRRVGVVLKERFDGATEVSEYTSSLKLLSETTQDSFYNVLFLLGSPDSYRIQDSPAPP